MPTKPSILLPSASRLMASEMAPSPAPVFFGQPEIERLVAGRNPVPGGEDSEQPVEAATDPGQERRHLGGAERNTGGAYNLAARFPDLVRVGHRASTGPTRSQQKQCATSCPTC